MFTVFIGYLTRKKPEVTLVLLGFFLAMFKIIQEGAFGIVTGGMVWENQGIPRLHGVTLNYRHPNSLAGLAVGALPFFLFLYKFQSKFIQLLFLLGIIGLLLMTLYTGSRTGYVATAVLFFIILKRLGFYKFKPIFLSILLIVSTVYLTPDEYKSRFSTIFGHGDDRGSSAVKRIEILVDAYEIFKKHPLGIGVSAFPKVREAEFGRIQDTHNLYLEVLTNLGPLGLLAFFLFISAIFKTNNESRKIFLQNEEYFLAELAYVINTYLICRLTLGLFGMDLYEVYWWFAAGFTISLSRLASNLNSQNKESVTPIN